MGAESSSECSPYYLGLKVAQIYRDRVNPKGELTTKELLSMVNDAGRYRQLHDRLHSLLEKDYSRKKLVRKLVDLLEDEVPQLDLFMVPEQVPDPDLKRRYRQLKREHRETVEELKKVSNKYSRLLSQLYAAQNAMILYKTQWESAKKKERDLSSNIDRLNSEVHTSKERESQLVQDLEKREVALGELQKQIDVGQELVDEMEGQFSLLQKELERKQKDLIAGDELLSENVKLVENLENTLEMLLAQNSA